MSGLVDKVIDEKIEFDYGRKVDAGPCRPDAPGYSSMDWFLNRRDD
jgi:hypothetical protein